MRVILLRHETPPLPMGCRWCGVDKQTHVQLWVPGHSWHGWVQPTTAQIEARLPFNLARQRNRAPVEQALKSKARTDNEGETP